MWPQSLLSFFSGRQSWISERLTQGMYWQLIWEVIRIETILLQKVVLTQKNKCKNVKKWCSMYVTELLARWNPRRRKLLLPIAFGSGGDGEWYWGYLSGPGCVSWRGQRAMSSNPGTLRGKEKRLVPCLRSLDPASGGRASSCASQQLGARTQRMQYLSWCWLCLSANPMGWKGLCVINLLQPLPQRSPGAACRAKVLRGTNHSWKGQTLQVEVT